MVAQINRCERRQYNFHRIWLAMRRKSLRQHLALVSDVRAAIELRIAVENFAPSTVERHPDAVTIPRDRRHVGDHKDRRIVSSIAQKRKYRIGAIVADGPLETGWLAIALMKRGFRSMESIEIANQPLNTSMHRLLQ